MLDPSTKNRLPLVSPHTAYGAFKVALVGSPPSPLAAVASVEAVPVPAKVEMIPAPSTLRITWLSTWEMYALPPVST
jgi:hypothetical protein